MAEMKLTEQVHGAVDQLRLELVELHAIAELVGESAELALEGHVRPGVGATLSRIHDRISAIVEGQLAAGAAQG